MTAPESRKGAEPVACRLGDAAAGTQLARWRELGRAAALDRTATADGVRVRFRNEPAVERELQTLVAVERDCCAWARWRVERDAGALVLRVSAGGAGIEALQAVFADDGGAPLSRRASARSPRG